MNVAQPIHTAAGPAAGLIALQAVPARGPVVWGGAPNATNAGTTPGPRLVAAAGVGPDVAVTVVALPVDSFATRASQQVHVLPATHGVAHSSVDVPGFLSLALAVAGFALRQLGDNRR